MLLYIERESIFGSKTFLLSGQRRVAQLVVRYITSNIVVCFRHYMILIAKADTEESYIKWYVAGFSQKVCIFSTCVALLLLCLSYWHYYNSPFIIFLV